MNSVLEMMNSVLKMMNSVLKMITRAGGRAAAVHKTARLVPGQRR